MKVIWEEPASRRLDEVYEFIAAESLTAAVKIFNDIVNQTARLADFPQMAAVEPLLVDLPETFRSLVIHRNYKAVYYIDNAAEEVIIVDLWDCRQNPSDLTKSIKK